MKHGRGAINTTPSQRHKTLTQHAGSMDARSAAGATVPLSSGQSKICACETPQRNVL